MNWRVERSRSRVGLRVDIRKRRAAVWLCLARGLMKTTVFLLSFVSALAAFAADPPAQFSANIARPGIPISSAERQMDFISAKRDAPVIALGKSDYVLGGPLVAGLRKLPPREDLTRVQRFLRLPIIRLVVPGPMERPPGGTGKYFAWRNDNSALPWAAAANMPVGARWTDNWRDARPDWSLIQLHK